MSLAAIFCGVIVVCGVTLMLGAHLQMVNINDEFYQGTRLDGKGNISKERVDTLTDLYRFSEYLRRLGLVMVLLSGFALAVIMHEKDDPQERTIEYIPGLVRIDNLEGELS